MEVSEPEGRERSGRIAHGLATPASTTPIPSRQEDLARVPTEPKPGRSFVTRQAVTDLVRTATLGSYGVTGFAARPHERLLERLGLVQPGIAVHLGATIDIDLDLTVAFGVPGRGGRPPGRFGGPLLDPACARSRGRAGHDPRRRPAVRAGRGAAGGHPRRRPMPSGRATSPTAGRTSPDGPPRLRRRRPARRLPRGGREPRGARRRDQRAERLSRSPTATPARTCSRPSRRRSRRPRASPASRPNGSPRPSASGR